MSTSSATRPYHHGALRQALVAEALRVISEHGEAALSLRDLARRLGVSHAAPYRHFATMDALMAAIAEEGFELLAADVERAVANEANPVEQLGEAGWAYVRFALEHPHHFRVMFNGRLTGGEEFAGLQAAMSRSYAALLRTIEAGQVAGEIAGADVRELATSAWVHVHGLATLLLECQLGASSLADSERIARRAIEILICGLGIHEGRPPEAGKRAL